MSRKALALLALGAAVAVVVGLVILSEARRNDHAAGREAFLSAGCGGCHTLRDARTIGRAAPDLDYADPTKPFAVGWITGGAAGMPAYKSVLSPSEIDRIAAYVAAVSGRP